MSAANKKKGFPRQIKYIVGNEAAERFSYYGMRSILVVFMTTHLMMTEQLAKETYHLFVSAVYFLPLLGGYLSDRFLGKYKTIIALSLVYCLGHLTLALFDSRMGLYAGLGLIALGSGGIKPCVSAHVGDQFDESNQNLLQKVFDVFYWSVNFGAFFSTLMIPVVLTKIGSAVAFGIPGVLMAISTVIFWMGRKYYVHVPPTGKTGTRGFMPILLHTLKNFGKRKAGQEFFDLARGKFTAEEIEGAKAAWGVIKVFVTVSIFWALFDQQGSSWVLQAQKMNLNVWGMKLEASQMQAWNPIMILVLIPIFSLGLYPAVEKMGIKLTPLRKMATGMLFAGFSFIFVGALQVAIDSGHDVSAGWQFFPYLIITASEVLVSITGLEFAYTQAPRSMKSTLMSFWLLTITFGDLLDAVIAKLNPFQGATYFFFFAGLMFAVAMIFVWSAMRYKVRNFIESKSPGMAPAAG